MPIATASSWVNKFLIGIRAEGRVLDVAAGSGRHTRRALEAGYRVTAVDRDISGLNDLVRVSALTAIEYDLESGAAWPFKETFDGVIVTNYLWRPILPDIISAVGPAGVLIYETFGQGNERFGGPKNPDFLLRPGELCDVVAGRLAPLAYQFATIENTTDHSKRIISRICAVGLDHPWRDNPPAP